MDSVGIRELRARTSEILRRVPERKGSIEMTCRGTVVARIVPVFEPPTIDRSLGRRLTDEEWERLWAELDELSARISEAWPEGISAVDALREQRRDL